MPFFHETPIDDANNIDELLKGLTDALDEQSQYSQLRNPSDIQNVLEEQLRIIAQKIGHETESLPETQIYWDPVTLYMRGEPILDYQYDAESGVAVRIMNWNHDSLKKAVEEFLAEIP